MFFSVVWYLSFGYAEYVLGHMEDETTLNLTTSTKPRTLGDWTAVADSLRHASLVIGLRLGLHVLYSAIT
jgi:hypothetical protein